MASDDVEDMWRHRYVFTTATTPIELHIREDLDAGLGGTLFDGSVALARLLESMAKDQPAFLQGKRVLELGSGCGLPGLLAGKLGAAQVVLTDIAQCVELMQENIDGNDLGDCVSAAALNWTLSNDADSVEKEFGSNFDFILAADVVYSPELVHPLYALLIRFSGPRTQILFSAPRPRVQEATDAFFATLRNEADFEVEKISASRFVPDLKPGSKQFTREHEGLFAFRLKQRL